MMLQEPNYRLLSDGEIEDEGNSHRFVEQRDTINSVDVSNVSSCEKMTPQGSFGNNFRRSTFDLSSFNSLATSCSDGSSYSSPSCSPARKTTGLRCRRQSSSGKTSSSEGAATRTLLQQARDNGMKSPSMQEIREEPTGMSQSLNTKQGENDRFAQQASADTTCTKDLSIAATAESRSSMQYFLEAILLGCLVIPILELTISIERYIRSIFGDLQRNAGSAFTSIYDSASSLRKESVNSCAKLYASSIASLQNLQKHYLLDEKEYSTDSACCYSTSSSSDDDNNSAEREHDSWGHFADFRDELADEASFIPFCSGTSLRNGMIAAVAVPPSCANNTLETLAEGREEDDDSMFWLRADTYRTGNATQRQQRSNDYHSIYTLFIQAINKARSNTHKQLYS